LSLAQNRRCRMYLER